jgi:hypothetical protein
MPFWNKPNNIVENIPSGTFVTNHSRFEVKEKKMNIDDLRYVQPIIMQHWIVSIQT